MHKASDSSSIKASLYDITKGLFTLARIRTSFKAFCFSLSERPFNFTFLRAYILESSFLLTLKTVLYAPSPILSRISIPFI